MERKSSLKNFALQLKRNVCEGYLYTNTWKIDKISVAYLHLLAKTDKKPSQINICFTMHALIASSINIRSGQLTLKVGLPYKRFQSGNECPHTKMVPQDIRGNLNVNDVTVSITQLPPSNITTLRTGLIAST